MPKFWPSEMYVKENRETKFKSTDLDSKMKHLFFPEWNTKTVKEIGLEIINNSYKDIRIEILVKDYEISYNSFNWLNVNYFMSDYNEFFPNIETSYWTVEGIKPTYQKGQLIKMEYTLHLDEWSTFYDYIWNVKGNVELLENHNDRFIKDKDNLNIPDLLNNPFIQNCDDYCTRFDNKIEFQIPNTLYDSKHIDLHLKPTETADKRFFEVGPGNEVIKQLRGWILVWATHNEANKISISQFGSVLIPFKLFLFPVFDEIDKKKWLAGTEAIQKNYRIELSNIIGDIIVYEDLNESKDIPGWYESGQNNFRISETNGFVDTEFVGKIGYTDTEIRNQIIEPHLHSLTHEHYELANVGKQSIQFNLLQLLKNSNFISAPNVSKGNDKPIKFDLTKYNQMDFNKVLYWNDNGTYRFWVGHTDKKSIWELKTNTGTNLVDFVNNSVKITDNRKWLVGMPYYWNKLERGGRPGQTADIYKKAINSKSFTNDLDGGIAEGSNPLIIVGKTETVWYNINKNVISIEEKSDSKEEHLGAGTTFYSYWKWREASFSKKENKYVNFFYKSKDNLISNWYTAEDMNNAGNVGDNVLGYEITGMNDYTGKYYADFWYILSKGQVYRLPVNQVYPNDSTKIKGNDFWYNNDTITLTKNLGIFSNEEMGLKSILLDTESSISYKLNNNTFTLNMKGAYSYPTFTDAYVEFLKGKINQFNAGYANIDATEATGKTNAGFSFLGSAIGGLTSGALTGGGLGMTGKIGGLTGAGIGAVGGGMLGLLTGGLSYGNQLRAIETQAQNGRRTLDAQLNDAKKLHNNYGVVGLASTISDTMLKQYESAQTHFKNYWNYWTPVLHKWELTAPDKQSVKLYFNKFGYKQDRFIIVDSLQDLCNRWAFNRVKLANPVELLSQSGLSPTMVSDTAEDFANGLWIWDLDKVNYEDILNYTINNFETKFYIQPDNMEYALEIKLEDEVIK